MLTEDRRENLFLLTTTIVGLPRKVERRTSNFVCPVQKTKKIRLILFNHDILYQLPVKPYSENLCAELCIIFKKQSPEDLLACWGLHMVGSLEYQDKKDQVSHRVIILSLIHI